MIQIFGESVPKDVIGDELIAIGEKNDKVVVLSSDVSVSCNVEKFHEEFPTRFFEMGIAEQSTMSVAGGLATEGFIPVYVALAIFSCGMTYPQMRQVCNSNLNVKIIGTHAGVDDGQDGSGHHATEDMAISRSIPRMTVLAPSDEVEVRAAVKAAIDFPGAVYIRVAREEQPIIHCNEDFVIGKAETIEDLGNDFAIVYEGTAQKQAIEGWKLLCDSGRNGKLVNIRTIKPIDRDIILSLAEEVPVIVTVENHSVVGGLYSTVCEILAGKPHNTIVKAVGFLDEFTESGSSKDIKQKYGLTGEKVFKMATDI